MCHLFENSNFDRYSLDEIPLDRDCYLMSEEFIDEYEKSLLKVFSGGEYEPVGYISYAAVRAINDTSLEIAWYPNIYDRFHEMAVTLPRTEVIACIGSWRWSEKPHIFVKSAWLNSLYLRSHSVFGLIDAIGVKKAIQNGTLTRERLLALRDEIDTLGKSYPQITFISFADTVLIKSNWSVGYVGSGVPYNYQPEIFITIVKESQAIFKRTLELAVYAVLTQGSNEYYKDSLLHISEAENHVCLNSLGLPFAQLLAIDESARSHYKTNVHPASDLYMDKAFYHSLNFKFEFQRQKTIQKYPYKDKFSGGDAFYYAAQLHEVLDNLN